MNNTITASINFCFKGQTHEPTIELDLDAFMQRSAQFSEIYMMLAKANDFDLYSYEYEMMQAEPITIVQASGLVEEYVVDGLLDIQGFEQAWNESAVIDGLAIIAEKTLSIDNLDDEPNLKQALLEAYNLGCSVK